jgi:hypothetical protein
VFIVLAIVLPVLRFAAFEYPLGIFKLFLDNIFVHFGGRVFKHTIGILMGAKCAPLLTDLFILAYDGVLLPSGIMMKNYPQLLIPASPI